MTYHEMTLAATAVIKMATLQSYIKAPTFEVGASKNTKVERCEATTKVTPSLIPIKSTSPTL